MKWVAFFSLFVTVSVLSLGFFSGGKIVYMTDFKESHAYFVGFPELGLNLDVGSLKLDASLFLAPYYEALKDSDISKTAFGGGIGLDLEDFYGLGLRVSYSFFYSPSSENNFSSVLGAGVFFKVSHFKISETFGIGIPDFKFGFETSLRFSF